MSCAASVVASASLPYCGHFREPGRLRTSAIAAMRAPESRARNSSIGRVECPIVEIVVGAARHGTMRGRGEGAKDGRANEALFTAFHTDTIDMHHLAAEPARHTQECDANNRQENGNAHVWADTAGVARAQPDIYRIQHDRSEVDRHVRKSNLLDRRRTPFVVEQVDKSRYRCTKSAYKAAYHTKQ